VDEGVSVCEKQPDSAVAMEKLAQSAGGKKWLDELEISKNPGSISPGRFYHHDPTD
jgi:hypothetical protein